MSDITKNEAAAMNGAADCAKAFFDAIASKRWPDAYALSTSTWRAGQGNTSFLISEMFGHLKFTNNTLQHVNMITMVCVDITLSLDDVTTKRVIARVIRENSPYQTSRTGRWGVNPISATRKVPDDKKI